jgi:hypothetical protein
LVCQPVPAGEHVIDVEFDGTPARRAALIISGLSVALVIFFAWRIYRRSNNLEAVEYHPLVDADGTRSEASLWPVLAVTLAITLAFIVLVEPMGWLRYNSEGSWVTPAEYHPMVNFGDQADLIGYDFPKQEIQADDSVKLTIYWKARQPLGINYQSFVHILGADGSPVAQSDKLNPGAFPSKLWPLDRYIRDEHLLDLPENLPAGEYRLSIGLWSAGDGWRLPVIGENGDQIGDNFVLPQLLVVVE